MDIMYNEVLFSSSISAIPTGRIDVKFFWVVYMNIYQENKNVLKSEKRAFS